MFTEGGSPTVFKVHLCVMKQVMHVSMDFTKQSTITLKCVVVRLPFYTTSRISNLGPGESDHNGVEQGHRGIVSPDIDDLDEEVYRPQAIRRCVEHSPEYEV